MAFAAIDREAIYAALFERLKKGVPGVRFWTRREVTSDEMPTMQYPAGVLVVWDQSPEQSHDMPPKWRLTAMLGVWTVARKMNQTPDSELNDIVRQVENALVRQPMEDADSWTTTLGGLVHHAWISGPVEFYQGEASGQGEVRLQIEMLAA